MNYGYDNLYTSTLLVKFKNGIIYLGKGHLIEVELLNDLKIKEKGTKFPCLELCEVKATNLILKQEV